MDITEVARIKLVIDGAEAGKNELSKINDAMASLTSKRDEYTRGTKEWKEYNNLIKEQTKLYKSVEERMDVMKMTLPQLISYQRDLAKAIGEGNADASERIKDVNTRIAEMRAAQRAVNEEVDKQPGIWDKAKAAFLGFFAAFTLEAAINMLKDFAMTGIQKAAAFSDAFGTIMKTTGMTKEEVRALNTEVEKIDTRTAQEELLKIGAVGGQIGVAKEEMEGFVEATDMAVVALGDEFTGGTEEVTKSLGTLKNLFSETKDLQFGDAIQRIGSSLNELGASGMATAPVVADFVQRIGALGNLAPEITQTMGLGAAFQELGLTAEIAASGLGNILLNASRGTADFAKQMGITEEAFKSLINNSPNDMLLQLAASFKGMPVEVLVNKMADLGLKGNEATKVMMLLRDQTEMVAEKQAIANKAYTEGISLKNEFNVMNNTEQAQLEKSEKAIEAQQRALGERLLPAYIKWNQAKAEGIGLLGKYGGALTQFGVAIGSVIAIKKTYTAYQELKNAWDLKNIASTGSLTLAERVALVLKGQWTLATQGQAVAAGTLTVAQQRATAAAAAFNATLSSNAILLAAAAAMYSLYEIYKLTAESIQNAKDTKLDYIKTTDTEIATEQRNLTQLGLSVEGVKKLKEGTEARRIALESLIQKYPDYFKGMSAEEMNNARLEDVYKRVNSQIQQKINLMAREKQVDNITNQLTDLKSKMLAGGVSSNTMEGYLSEIRSGASSAFTVEMQKYEQLTRQLTEAQGGLAKAHAQTALEEAKALAASLRGGEILRSEYMEQSNVLTQKYKLKTRQFSEEEIQEQKKRDGVTKTTTVVLNADKQESDSNSNKNKKKAKDNDSARKAELQAEKNHNQQMLDMAVAYAANELEVKKAKLYYELQEAERKINSEIDAEQKKTKKKDDINTLEQRRLKELEQLQKTYLKELANSEEEYWTKTKDGWALNSKAVAEAISKISKAIESDGDKIKVNIKINGDQINEFYQRVRDSQEAHLTKYNSTAAENRRMEKLAQDQHGVEFIKLTKKQQEKITDTVREESQHRRQVVEMSFSILQTFMEVAMGAFDESMQRKIDSTSSALEKAHRENERMWKQTMAGLSNVASAWTKSIADGVVATFAWMGQVVLNEDKAFQRIVEARRQYFSDTIGEWTQYMSQNSAEIQKHYEKFLLLNSALIEYNKAMNLYDPKVVIDNELLRADMITETYNKAVGKEKELLALRLENINKVYSAEVERINNTYRQLQDQADAQYTNAGNAVKQRMADELLALITNEDSKLSIVSEYEKEKQKRLDAFSWATENRRDQLAEDIQSVSGQLATAESDLIRLRAEAVESGANITAKEAELKGTIASLKGTLGGLNIEYDSITKGIEARNEELSKLMDWYTKELETIVNSEGQKRTVYSETEKIKIKAEQDLEDLRIQKASDDIQREKDKNTELLAAEQNKNALIEAETARYNKELIRLGQEKDAALLASFLILKDATLQGYDEMLASAKEAYSWGYITLEQYRKLVEEANRLRASVGEGAVVTNNNPQINENLNKGILGLSPTNTNNWEKDRIAQYLEWLKNNGLEDSIGARSDFMGSVKKYAAGTEYVDAENRYPDGVDTVPSLLTKGEGVLNTEDNAEKIALGLNNKQLLQMARLGVVARNTGMMNRISTSSIAQTGMPVYSRPVSTYTGGKDTYTIDITKLERHLQSINTKLDLLELLTELGELKKVKEEIRVKPVLSLEKLQRAAEADALNKDRSTFR